MTVVNFLESSSLKFVTYLIKCFRVAAGKASVPKTCQLPGKGGGTPSPRTPTIAQPKLTQNPGSAHVDYAIDVIKRFARYMRIILRASHSMESPPL